LHLAFQKNPAAEKVFFLVEKGVSRYNGTRIGADGRICGMPLSYGPGSQGGVDL
jgi:hypothetical protein